MKKILGWIILILGVTAILWGLWTSIDIFTGQRPVYEVFEYEEDNSGQEDTLGQGIETEEDIGRLIKQQISEIFPPATLFKFFNLAAWGIFMMILVLTGGKLAAIGTNLIKKEDGSD